MTPDPSASPWAAQARTVGAAVYEASIASLQQMMTAGALTARDLVTAYTARIQQMDAQGPRLRSVIELNPDALAIAAALDAERAAGTVRGPLHGIPILVKDNIDTADGMHTAAGSLALLDSRPPRDATVVQRLRAAGAIILGKANLSEWAFFRSEYGACGWSGRGGQARNPYVLDRSPGGSSAGSAAAVAASFAAAALGTETNGSIVCPSSLCGVVGIKPTVGLTSRAGVIPIAHSQDTVGPHARTVADAAILLGALTGVDPADPATAASAGQAHADYTPFLEPAGLAGARIGVARRAFGHHPATDHIIESMLDVMREAGATISDPADLPTAEEIAAAPSKLTVLLYEFKADLNAYLATRLPRDGRGAAPQVRTLADLIAFNRAHAAAEMPYFGQELLELAEAKGPLTDQDYQDALATNHRLSRALGLDAALDRDHLDALVAPTYGPAWPIDVVNGENPRGGSSTPAALAGYPLLTLPVGQVHGLPVGLTFMGRAFSEPTLIRLAYALEQRIAGRQPPIYMPTIPL